MFNRREEVIIRSRQPMILQAAAKKLVLNTEAEILKKIRDPTLF